MSESETVPLLKCPNCGADDSFTSWELTSMAYHGVRFFVSPVGSGRDVDYDGVYDTESGDGGEFDNDITCRNCDTMSLTIESLLDAEGKPAEPEPDTFGKIYVDGEKDGIRVQLLRADDGALLVQIDTENEPYGEHVLRVYVNDGRVFDGEDEPKIDD